MIKESLYYLYNIGTTVENREKIPATEMQVSTSLEFHTDSFGTNKVVLSRFVTI